MEVKELIAQVKSFKEDEQDEFLRGLLDDEELREDLLDYTALLQAEAEGNETAR